ncbi:MAG: serine/threonine protein phosphatase [Bacteroidetes bacterium]|nr:serine/threonine protein phosphatase [Bacteroidota bacterium]
MSRWVVSDIHGCVKTLRCLLEDKIGPTRQDIVYFLGDYIDRGPDSKGVIDYIMSLQEQNYQIELLKGNHEDFFLETYYEEKRRPKGLARLLEKRIILKKDLWNQHGGKETMKSFGTRNILQIPSHYIEWLKKLKLFIELDDFFLVHAGFNFDVEDIFKDTVAMLWTRAFKVDPARLKNKKIIHGHVPAPIDDITFNVSRKDYYFLGLDNGCYEKNSKDYGSLIALELDSFKLYTKKNID